MIKQIKATAICCVILSGFYACSNKGGQFKKTETGLEYRIIKDEKGGPSPVEGDMIGLHLLVHLGDSVLMDTRKMNNNMPVEIPLMPPSFKGDWVEGIKLLTAGDSAEFLIPVDTLKKISGGNMPEWMKSGQKVSYNVTLISVKPQAEAKKEQEQKSAQQNATDDKLLQDYFAKNGLAPQKTASGVYYIISKPGAGPSPVKGQVVTVDYTGKTLEGKTFDSNVDPKFQHVEPFKFRLFSGEAIPGWDEGVSLLNKGAKALIFVPSSLAYGANSQGDIAANSVLIFDVEVKNIEDAK